MQWDSNAFHRKSCNLQSSFCSNTATIEPSPMLSVSCGRCFHTSRPSPTSRRDSPWLCLDLRADVADRNLNHFLPVSVFCLAAETDSKLWVIERQSYQSVLVQSALSRLSHSVELISRWASDCPFDTRQVQGSAVDSFLHRSRHQPPAGCVPVCRHRPWTTFTFLLAP